MALYSLKDWQLVISGAVLITTGPGSVASIPLPNGQRLISFTKVTFDPGGDAEYILGAGIKPIGVAIKTSKGKLDIDLSNGAESWDLRKRLGGVGSSCAISLIGARSGMPPESFLFLPATFKNGGGFDLDESKGTPDKISFLFTDCKQNGVSIYNELA